MTLSIPAAQKFAFREEDEKRLRERFPSIPRHKVEQAALDAVDPLTYEVVRHRLVAITTEMGSALRRMSGSIIVSEINDFNVAIMDEIGDVVQFGLYNMQLSASVDMAVKWTLQNRAENPGISPGDMFLGTDPWVGGGMHQNDVSLLAPIFVGDEIFGWTAAIAHQVDLGGVAPGSWSTRGRDVFWESLPLPPIKVVEAGVVREDIEDSYLRRSRVPDLVALDLRAKIGANNIGVQRIARLVERYGADTVKAVMQLVMDDAERRLRTKLGKLPDGEWTATAYQDSAREGDDGVYRINCTMRKVGSQLAFDFRGSDPQVEGFINCTRGGLRAGVVSAILPTLCPDIPWSSGGLLRAIDIQSDVGAINDCEFPAGVGKASVASSFATQSAAIECISGLLDSAADDVIRETLSAVPCGGWDLAILAGVDQHERPFVAMIGDPMAAGGGALGTADGGDTAGLFGIPMGKIADVEMNEFQYPMLYLWRREEADSGGPGRFRGGVGGSSCFIVHGGPENEMHLVVSQSGKALPQAQGVSGGAPGNTGYDVLARGTDIRALLAAGHIPGSLDELSGDMAELPAHLETSIGFDDVYYMGWQGGGGYGDPLLREPGRVVEDLRSGRITAAAAFDVYGVVLDGDRADLEATCARRDEMRTLRGDGRALAPHGHDAIAVEGAARIDDNLLLVADGSVACVHCGTALGLLEDHRDNVVRREGPAGMAGPQILGDPEAHAHTPIRFRQLLCPGCGTSLEIEVVPEGEPAFRSKLPVLEVRA